MIWRQVGIVVSFGLLLAAGACSDDQPEAEPSGTIEGDGASVEIPDGASDGTSDIGVALIAVSAEPPADTTVVSDAFAFTPHGRTFTRNVIISIPYPSEFTNNLVMLRLADPSASAWQALTGARFLNGRAEIETDTFSVYAVGSVDDAGDTDDMGLDIVEDIAVDVEQDTPADLPADGSDAETDVADVDNDDSNDGSDEADDATETSDAPVDGDDMTLDTSGDGDTDTEDIDDDA